MNMKRLVEDVIALNEAANTAHHDAITNLGYSQVGPTVNKRLRSPMADIDVHERTYHDSNGKKLVHIHQKTKDKFEGGTHSSHSFRDHSGKEHKKVSAAHAANAN